MYFHGSTQCAESPFAHKDKHTFWVYPETTPLTNKWDTHHPATQYCTNHKDEGAPPTNPALKQYVCLGHTSREEMALAELEWQLRTKAQKNVHRIQTIQDVIGLREKNDPLVIVVLALLELVKEQQKDITTMQLQLEAQEQKYQTLQASVKVLTTKMEKPKEEETTLVRKENPLHPPLTLYLIQLLLIAALYFLFYYYIYNVVAKVDRFRTPTYIDSSRQIHSGVQENTAYCIGS